MESGNRNGYSQVGFIDDRDRSVGGNSGAPVEVLRRFHGGRRRTPTQQHHRAGHAVRGRLSGQCGRTRAFIPCSLLLSRVADDRRALRRILTDTHAHILGEEGRGVGRGRRLRRSAAAVTRLLLLSYYFKLLFLLFRKISVVPHVRFNAPPVTYLFLYNIIGKLDKNQFFQL